MALVPDPAAINALTYSYSALTTGAQVVGQQILWTEERIRSTVNIKYVSGRLKEADRPRLNFPLAFGDGLTDDTYLDFILERANKLFLALCEIGKQEQIFRAIDLSYDDGDLPLPQETVPGLGLAAKEDDKINRRFHAVQHRFLLRELEGGGHTDYAPEETVPLEYIYQAAATHSLQTWIRVRVPSRPGELMARRRLCTSTPDDPDILPPEFLEDMEAARLIEHDHIAPIWSSYTSQGAGYIITPFVAEYTLKSYLEAKYSPQFQQLSKPDRQRLLLKWMHCLSDALAYLHAAGFQHTKIKPSNIVIDAANNVAFSDIGCLGSFQQDKISDKAEAYNYSVPEAHVADRTPYIMAQPAVSRAGFGARLFRRKRSSSRTSSDESSNEGSHDEWLGGSNTTRQPKTSLSEAYFRENVTSAGRFDSLQQTPHETRPVASSDASFVPTEKADLFSIGCIFVDLLSYMHKFRPPDVTKHIRSQRKATKAQKFGSSHMDTSYHGNLPRVHTWLDGLEDNAFENDDTCFRAIPHLIRMVRTMLCPDPEMRPTAIAVRDHIKGILTQFAKIDEEDLHCCHMPLDDYRTSYSTYPSSEVLSSISSPAMRNSAYTASSRYASTTYSRTSASAAKMRESQGQGRVARASTRTDYSQPIPWGTFPGTPA